MHGIEIAKGYLLYSLKHRGDNKKRYHNVGKQLLSDTYYFLFCLYVLWSVYFFTSCKLSSDPQSHYPTH